MFYQGQGLPADRESYLLLDVLDVPPAPKVPNAMQIALRHRLKLFYRPPLKTTPDQAMVALEWTLPASGSTAPGASNPSPYYLTLSNLEVLDAQDRLCGEPLDHLMLAPFSEHRLETATCHPASLRYDVISDAGNPRPHQATLVPGGKATAIRR
ncbi:putative fimbrial chaperone YadV [compost metagenome]